MNEIKFLPFGENGFTSIGTANLNGCSAIMILSNFGAILGHIAPLPDNHAGNPAAGDEHAKSKMSLLQSLYTSNQRYFPTGSDGWVVCAMFDGEVALPDQQRIFERVLTDLHLPCSLRTYTVAATRARSEESPGKGTVFISGNGNSPTVYVEDVEVTIGNPPRGGSSSTTGYGVSSAAPFSHALAVPECGSSPTSCFVAPVASSTYAVVPAGLLSYASQSTTHTSSPDEPYYYVQDRVHYYYANGTSTRLADRPKNVWVLNENGWADTNRQKKWRYWDGRTVSFG